MGPVDGPIFFGALQMSRSKMRRNDHAACSYQVRVRFDGLQLAWRPHEKLAAMRGQQAAHKT